MTTTPLMMFDPLRDSSPVPSPCISVCKMDDDGLCGGCQRNIPEIKAWSTASDAAKRSIWRDINARRSNA